MIFEMLFVDFNFREIDLWLL